MMAHAIDIVLGGASVRPSSRHADLSVLAQSRRALVLQDRARCYGAGIFTSVTDLRRKLTRYIEHYNKTATPIRWAYADPSRRIA
jgi:hypothetical protein